MNCDECREQVLELVEREAIDPEGVRAILAECPDCRAEFEEVKAMLAVAAQLPVEAPPAQIDALIVERADARETAVSRPEKRAWGPPLAMAAVALLVVGIGVSTFSIIGAPREELAAAPALGDDVAELEAPTDLAKAAGSGSMGETVAGVSTDLAAPSEPSMEKQGAPRPARTTRAGSRKKEEARRAASKPSSKLARADREEGQYAAADAPAARAGAPESAETLGAVAQKSRVAEEEADADLESECARTVRTLEKRRRKDQEYEPTPEAQLEAGLCYRLLGKRDEARGWLQRAAEHPSTRARANAALGELE